MYAKVIKDSMFGNSRLITMEVEFHRFILPEVNTHRVFSRNYQSSRAVPVKNMIKQVWSNPAIPVEFGKNKSGMQADEAVNHKRLAEFLWRAGAKLSAIMAYLMMKVGVHKQVTNRIIEPFMSTKGVITASYEGWESFFKLRIHPDAQPEIRAIALKIHDAISSSKPQSLKSGEWHLPYVDSKIGNIDNIMKSTSCVAQVSYRKLDDSIDKAKMIYSMLNLPEDGVEKEDPPHYSPAEHVAKYAKGVSGFKSGNFDSRNIYQYRKMLETGEEKNETTT